MYVTQISTSTVYTPHKHRACTCLSHKHTFTTSVQVHAQVYKSMHSNSTLHAKVHVYAQQPRIPVTRVVQQTTFVLTLYTRLRVDGWRERYDRQVSVTTTTVTRLQSTGALQSTCLSWLQWHATTHSTLRTQLSGLVSTQPPPHIHNKSTLGTPSINSHSTQQSTSPFLAAAMMYW